MSDINRVKLADLLEKTLLSETDIFIIQDSENTKKITLKNLILSCIKDNEVPAAYRIYSSEKIQKMIDELNTYLERNIGIQNSTIEKLKSTAATEQQLNNLNTTLSELINSKVSNETLKDLLQYYRHKNVSITSADLSTASDEEKIKLAHLSKEVLSALTGNAEVAITRSPAGGWTTEDYADKSITGAKLSSNYRFRGYFTEGDINDYIDDGIYILGCDITNLPKDENDEDDLRLLTVTRSYDDMIIQQVEYLDDSKSHSVYRRKTNIGKLHYAPFTRLYELSDEFKVGNTLLDDQFSNNGTISNVSVFDIEKDGQYLADSTVSNLPKNESCLLSVKHYDDEIVYTAKYIGIASCEVFEARVYYTSNHMKVDTDWFRTSVYSKSKFDGKTVYLFGDGILYGLGCDDYVNNSIPSLLQTKYGFRVMNNCISEATAGSYDDDTLNERSIITQINNTLMTDADYVIILVGSKDWELGKPIGINDSDDESTFKGSLNKAIKSIYERNSKTRIVLCTPFFRSRIGYGDGKNSDDYTVNDTYLSSFKDAVIDIGKKYHIPVSNLFDVLGINKLNYINYLADDGIYLSDEGQELATDKIVSYMESVF